MNVRLNFLEAMYAAMKRRTDADRRVLARYETLIAEEHLRSRETARIPLPPAPQRPSMV